MIAQLDAAGIKRAAVLSTAYIWEQASRNVDNAVEKLRADNDWTSQQVAKYPDRLIGFCGINPLKDYALDELARCAKDPNLRRGVKMHFGNSGSITRTRSTSSGSVACSAPPTATDGDCRPHARVVQRASCRTAATQRWCS